MITDAQLRKAAEKSSDLYLRYVEHKKNALISKETLHLNLKRLFSPMVHFPLRCLVSCLIK